MTGVHRSGWLKRWRNLAPFSKARRQHTEGIVTLADAHYFPGVVMLYQSVQASDYPVPIACYDIGLTDDQRERAAHDLRGLQVLPIPDTHDIRVIRHATQGARLKKPGKRQWPLWICPFLIAASPFQRTFWIDADVVVLRNLEGLFRLLDDGPVLTPENLAPDATPNKPQLYELLPIARPFDPREPALNAGVSGWDLKRDERVLAAYMYPIRRAFTHPEVREAISWHDQGALIWAVQRHGLEHRVPTTTAWNRCVVHTAAHGRALAWDDTLLDTLRDLVPDANLLHWNGVAVPWGRPDADLP